MNRRFGPTNDIRQATFSGRIERGFYLSPGFHGKLITIPFFAFTPLPFDTLVRWTLTRGVEWTIGAERADPFGSAVAISRLELTTKMPRAQRAKTSGLTNIEPPVSDGQNAGAGGLRDPNQHQILRAIL